MNESDNKNIFISLCQLRTKQLSTAVINSTVCVQQCKKQNHRSYTVLCELQISLQDRKTITDILNQKSTDHNQCHKTKATSQRSEQMITNITQEINHNKIIWDKRKDVFTDR